MLWRMKFLRLAVILILLCATQAARAEVQKEFVILTGGPALMEWEKFKAEPHDRWWGNFVRASRVRIQQIREQYGPSANITWLVYRPGYVRRASRQDNADLISNINSVRDKYNVKLVWFDKTSQVINYLNAGQPRDRVKIVNFEYYGHSNRACFMFDYSNEVDSASKVFLHEDELRQIHRGIFTKDAFVKSWGCYTGESMSKAFRQATGKKMIGAIGKTDYAYGHLRGWVPALSSGSRWGG